MTNIALDERSTFINGHAEVVCVQDLRPGDRFTGISTWLVSKVRAVHLSAGIIEGSIETTDEGLITCFGSPKGLVYRLNSETNALEYMARLAAFDVAGLPVAVRGRLVQLIREKL